MGGTLFKRARRKIMTHMGCDRLSIDITEGLENCIESIAQTANAAPRSHNHREPISNMLRHQVWRRDDFRCVYCHRSINEVELEVDHVLPVCRGGTNALSNLQTLCVDCNRRKGAL